MFRFFLIFLFFCEMKKTSCATLITAVLCFFPLVEISAQKGATNIKQDSTITQLMETKKQIDAEVYASTFYTIQLFYGDNKTAVELFEKFKEEFPDWDADLSFETPNYKVQVGQFKDYYFGLNKLREIKKVYPAAFLLESKANY